MGKDKTKKLSISMSNRCNLTLPPSRVLTILKAGKLQRVSKASAVFAAAAAEALVKTILEACEKHLGNDDGDSKKRLAPPALVEAIRADSSLSKLLAGYVFVTSELLGKSTEIVLSKEARRKRRLSLAVAKANRVANKATAATEED